MQAPSSLYLCVESDKFVYTVLVTSHESNGTGSTGKF